MDSAAEPYQAVEGNGVTRVPELDHMKYPRHRLSGSSGDWEAHPPAGSPDYSGITPANNLRPGAE